MIFMITDTGIISLTSQLSNPEYYNPSTINMGIAYWQILKRAKGNQDVFIRLTENVENVELEGEWPSTLLFMVVYDGYKGNPTRQDAVVINAHGTLLVSVEISQTRLDSLIHNLLTMPGKRLVVWYFDGESLSQNPHTPKEGSNNE